MQFISVCFSGVYGVALDTIQAQEVLGQDQQAGFGPRSTQSSTVETSHMPIAFGVRKTEFDRLAS